MLTTGQYNNKQYTFFNTNEHFFKEKINYPLKEYDGYKIINILDNDIVYINDKPIIISNENYNTRGNVFIPLDNNEKYCESFTHFIGIYTANSFNIGNIEELKLSRNYKLLNVNGPKCIYVNKVPVIIFINNALSPYKIGISLEENAQKKLTMYKKTY